MSANAGFGVDVNIERPKFSRFGAKQNPNAPKRIPLGVKQENNETGYSDYNPTFQNNPFQQQKQQVQVQPQFFHQQEKRFDPEDRVEHMYPPDPPQEYQGFHFQPSNEPFFDDDIELEPLIIHREAQWF